MTKLKCSTGNKQCGDRCIPRSHRCHINEQRSSPYRSSSNHSNQARENHRPQTKSPNKGLIGAGAVATAALLTAGLILSRKETGPNKDKFKSESKTPTIPGYSRSGDLAATRAALTNSGGEATGVSGLDPVPNLENPGKLRRQLQAECPRPPKFDGEFTDAKGAIDNHIKSQMEYNKYIARIKAAEALEHPERSFFIDLEMTGVSSMDDHGYTPLNRGEPVSIGIVYAGSGSDELSVKIPVKPERKISPTDTAIHGITDADVAKARSFADLYPDLNKEFTGKNIFTYGPTDLIWIDDACRRNGLPLIEYANVIRNSDGSIDWDHDGTTADVRRLFGDFLGPKIDAKYVSYVSRELAKPHNKNLIYEEKIRKYAKPQGQVGYYIQLPAYNIPGINAGSHDPVIDSYRTKQLMINIAKGTATRP